MRLYATRPGKSGSPTARNRGDFSRSLRRYGRSRINVVEKTVICRVLAHRLVDEIIDRAVHFLGSDLEQFPQRGARVEGLMRFFCGRLRTHRSNPSLSNNPCCGRDRRVQFLTLDTVWQFRFPQNALLPRHRNRLCRCFSGFGRRRIAGIPVFNTTYQDVNVCF